MRRMLVRAVTVVPASLLTLIALSGCATLLGGGTSQTIDIQSSPSSANVFVRLSSGLDVSNGKTPLKVPVSRKGEYSVEIAAPGFQAQTITIKHRQSMNGWVYLNFFNLFFGAIVDMQTGAMTVLEPETISVTLRSGSGRGGENDEAGVTYSHIRRSDKNGRVFEEQVTALVPIAP